MNNDIRPPQRQPQPSRPPEPPSSTQSSGVPKFEGQQPQPSQQPLEQSISSTVDQPPQLPPVVTGVTGQPSKRSSTIKKIVMAASATIVLLLLIGIGWYVQSQQPVQSDATEKISITINPGSTPDQIGTLLHQQGLIRSKLAFSIFTRITGVQGNLKAGDYRLSPSDNLAVIVSELQKGQSNQFNITFYPGATLFDPTDIDDKKRTDVYTMLHRAGYREAEIKAAFAKSYDHSLLTDKPADATLEGYVYGDTYQFDTGASVESVLLRTFDEFYKQITERDLVEKLRKHDMTLHQGVILASIIEREVSGRVEDQRQVSQIFHLRLDEGMSLGADATFMYAAQQQNQPPTIDFDSPYNTRKVTGLPPGPISSPNITALEAVADPARGDYLYFVSGDDGTTHFAHTSAEHEENTRKYCTDLCYSIE